MTNLKDLPRRTVTSTTTTLQTATQTQLGASIDSQPATVSVEEFLRTQNPNQNLGTVGATGDDPGTEFPHNSTFPAASKGGYVKITTDGYGITTAKTGEFWMCQADNTPVNSPTAWILFDSVPTDFTLDFATQAEVDAGTIHNKPIAPDVLRPELDALKPLDEDDFVSNSEIKSPTQQSTRVYTNRLTPFLQSLGWVREGGHIKKGTVNKTLAQDAGSTIRVDLAGELQGPIAIAAQTVIAFRVYDRNGLVTTGLGGEDLTVPQTVIEQSWGYDNEGTLASIPGVRSDHNDSGAYRVFQNPINTTEYGVLLPQFIEVSVTTGLYQEDNRGYIRPAALDGWLYLGVAHLDENATKISYVIDEHHGGDSANATSSPEAMGYLYAADPTILTNTELSDGLIVGTGTAADYTETRILAAAATWAAATKQQIYPSTLGDSIAPSVLNLWAHTETATVEQQSTVMEPVGVRSAIASFAGTGQHVEHTITQAGTIEVAIKKGFTHPFTIQTRNPADFDAYVLGTDGNLTRDADGETGNQDIVWTVKDLDELIVVSIPLATAPIPLRIWGNDIGTPTINVNPTIEYAINVKDETPSSGPATFQSLQLLHQDTTFRNLTGGAGATIDFGVDLSAAEFGLFNFELTAGGDTYQVTKIIWIKHPGPHPALPAFYQDAHVDIDLDLSNLSTGIIHFRQVNVYGLQQSWFYGNGDNLAVVPTGMQVLTPRTLTLTTPSGTTNHTVYDELDWVISLIPPNGQEYVETGTFSNASAYATGCQGNVSAEGRIVIRASGADCSLTLTAQPIPGTVNQTRLTATNGAWLALAGGLELYIGTGGDDRPTIRFTDGEERLVNRQDAYRTASTGVWASWQDFHFFDYGSSATVQLRASGYNLGPNYQQLIVLHDQFSGDRWKIIYTMQADDNTALVDFSYWPESRISALSGI